MTFMSKALQIAYEGRFSCMPNPMVGCVIVKNSQIVGSGAHIKAGHAHAEINALAQAQENARGADVYVTLEPCCHFGKTPPCVDALIRAGVKSVHIAMIDPNPLVAGHGIGLLRNAGIEVFVGQMQEEAYQLNKPFFYYITHRKPFVIAKWAMSLDGKMASAIPGQWGPNRWISSEDARKHAHMLRADVAGIMVGENTVRVDDPSLTVRYDITTSITPRPIVLTAYGDLAHDRKLFQPPCNTLVITSKNACVDFLRMLDKNGIEHCAVLCENGLLFLPEVLAMLGERGISRILVEGGVQLLTEFFNQNLVHKLYTYVAPKIIGAGVSVSPIMNMKMNEDILVEKIITLGRDVCFITETLVIAHTYNDFIKKSKNIE